MSTFVYMDSRPAILSVILIAGCNRSNVADVSSTSNEPPRKPTVEQLPATDTSTVAPQPELNIDSLVQVRRTRIAVERAELEKAGVIGKWECSYSGYESIITLKKDGRSYRSTVDFTKSNSPSTTESLKRVGSKYLVLGSKTEEYYLVKEDGALELWDQQGLFTTARNAMPGVPSSPKQKFDPDTGTGKDFFFVAGSYSQSTPETLPGTDGRHWYVYLVDLNTTFLVNKESRLIESTAKGRVPGT